MRNFKNECSVLINEGILVPNNGNIRFVFRHSDRFDDSIDMLELNPRAYNCLRRAGITTISEIGKQWDELYRIRSSGAKTVKEIKNKFIAYYYNSLDTDKEVEEFWKDTIKATVEM
jgi:DNA-directed RNA polymerase, alpha subunit/40 kD subunit